MKEFTCCICGKQCTGWGNNPWPIVDDEESRCCDDCNLSEVIPARIAMMAPSRVNKK